MSKSVRILAALALLGIAPAFAQQPEKPPLLVFAAASLTNALGELSPAFEKSSGVTVKLSFAASSVLARQIEAGGKADVFVSADQEWMDYLGTRKLIDDPSRRNLVGNRLVLVAPADSAVQLTIAPGFPLLHALGPGGRLAVGDPDTVPAGRYARSALTALGAWDVVVDRLARADNVRGALNFVARGEAPLGIVYTTDALADAKVKIVGTFPADTHLPITYPAAAMKDAGKEARAYLLFLAGPDAAPVWRKHGFLELPKK